MDSKQESNVPTQVDAELGNYAIFSQNSGDNGLKFSTLYEARRSIVVFIHFVKALGAQINFDEFKRLDIDLNVVGCGKKSGIKSFTSDTKFPIDNLFVDPDRFTYNKLGMIRLNGFSELKGDGKKSQETTSSFIGGMSWSLWKQISRGKQGDVFQQGGAYVFDTTGKILYSFIDRSPEGHISVQQIQELARTYGKQPTSSQ